MQKTRMETSDPLLDPIYGCLRWNNLIHVSSLYGSYIGIHEALRLRCWFAILILNGVVLDTAVAFWKLHNLLRFTFASLVPFTFASQFWIQALWITFASCTICFNSNHSFHNQLVSYNSHSHSHIDFRYMFFVSILDIGFLIEGYNFLQFKSIASTISSSRIIHIRILILDIDSLIDFGYRFFIEGFIWSKGFLSEGFFIQVLWFKWFWSFKSV